MAQPMQAPSSVFFTSQPTAWEEVKSRGDVITSGDMNSSQTSNPPSASPLSATTGRNSISSLSPSVISPIPSRALANPLGCDEQADIPVSITAPSQLTLAAQQNDRIISSRLLDPSNNLVFPQELSSANPPPAFQSPTSQ